LPRFITPEHAHHFSGRFPGKPAGLASYLLDSLSPVVLLLCTLICRTDQNSSLGTLWAAKCTQPTYTKRRDNIPRGFEANAFKSNRVKSLKSKHTIDS